MHICGLIIKILIMCGIVCAFDLKQKSEILRPQVLEMSKKIRHRGPDWSGIYSDEKTVMAHERLAIVDPASGQQPLFSEDKKLVLAANGEIYNHRELRKQFNGTYNFQTTYPIFLNIYVHSNDTRIITKTEEISNEFTYIDLGLPASFGYGWAEV